MLVSILIPARNAERWIGQAIQSGLSQTWPRTEIIVVDDGSRDRTLEVARRFESPTVAVVTQERRGASAARNRALALAQGDYIQWLDADDLLESTKIATQLSAVERLVDPLTLLSSAFGVFYWRPNKARFTPTALWSDADPLEYLIRSFCHNLWMSPACWLVSRQLTDAAGPWNEHLTLNDDGEYFSRVVAASARVQFVPAARCYYRQSGPGQLSRSTDRLAFESFALSLSLSVDHLLALRDDERTRDAARRLLNHHAPSFHPHDMDLLQRVANRLGFDVARPSDRGKTRLIRALLGDELGSAIIAVVRRARCSASIYWDRLLYRLDPSSGM